MCLIAVYYRNVPDAVLVLGAQRDEYFNRLAHPPQMLAGQPRILCGIDQLSGGTWLGVNQYGLVVAVTNRPKQAVPDNPRSRGTLCRDLLSLPTADQAAEHAEQELARGLYDGANFLCIDAESGWVVCSPGRRPRVPLEPGFHLLSRGDPDDADDPRQRRARDLLSTNPDRTSEALLARLEAVLSKPPETSDSSSMVLRAADRGTVSSTLLAITHEPDRAIYRYAPGPPDRQPYEDYSQALRGLLR